MKIALNEERVAYADDAGVVRDGAKSALKQTWDTLAEMYTSDAEKLFFEEILDFDLFKSVALAKAEMETGQRVGGAAVDRKACFGADSSALLAMRACALGEIQRILAKCSAGLDEAFQNEKNHRGEYEFSFYDGLVRKNKKTTLRCSVAYKNYVVGGGVRCDWEQRLKSALVRKLVGLRTSGDFQISVAVDVGECGEKNAICDYVVGCLERSDDVAGVFGDLQRYFAFYLCKFAFQAVVVGSSDRVFAARDGNVVEIGFQKPGFLKIVFNGRGASASDVENALAR